MRDITLCHPRLQVLAGKLVEECAKQGLLIKTGETFRTVAEQDALYAQGRTKPGNIVTNAKGSTYSSQHQWGIAFDFFRNDGTGAYNESGRFFEKVGEIGKTIGLGWGGDWKSPVDRPHFYLPDWGSTTGQLKQMFGTFENFKKTWQPIKPVTYTEGFLLAADGKRWWYQYKDGSFAHSGWYWLTEATAGTSGWYLFDDAGYMLTGYQKDKAGESFFLCPDPGIDEGKCMVTDARGVLQVVGKYDFEGHRYIM